MNQVLIGKKSYFGNLPCKTTTYLSVVAVMILNMLYQQGTIINSDFKRYQGRIVLDQNLGKQFKVGVNANYSTLSTNGTQVSGGGNTAFNLLIRAWTYRPLASGSQSLDDLLTDAQDLDVVSNTNYQWNPILSANNE